MVRRPLEVSRSVPGVVRVLEVFFQYVVEYAADRQAYRGDRWVRTHVRFTSLGATRL